MTGATKTRPELELKRRELYMSLHTSGGMLDVLSFERLCRRIHIVELKIHSFKGGILYGKE